MARGPRAVRREVAQARHIEYLCESKTISERLRDAGSEVILKSQGALVRTELGRAAGRSESDQLREQLEACQYRLKELQRNYDNLSSLSANDHQELAQLRRAHADAERELHELRKAHDALQKDLAMAQSQTRFSESDHALVEQKLRDKTTAAEQKASDAQKNLNEAKDTIRCLQGKLMAEKESSRNLDKKLQDSTRGTEDVKLLLAEVQSAARSKEISLKEAESKLARLSEQDAEQKRRLQDAEAQLRAVAQQQAARQRAEEAQARLQMALESSEREVTSLRAGLDEERALVSAVPRDVEEQLREKEQLEKDQAEVILKLQAHVKSCEADIAKHQEALATSNDDLTNERRRLVHEVACISERERESTKRAEDLNVRCEELAREMMAEQQHRRSTLEERQASDAQARFLTQELKKVRSDLDELGAKCVCLSAERDEFRIAAERASQRASTAEEAARKSETDMRQRSMLQDEAQNRILEQERQASETQMRSLTQELEKVRSDLDEVRAKCASLSTEHNDFRLAADRASQRASAAEEAARIAEMDMRQRSTLLEEAQNRILEQERSLGDFQSKRCVEVDRLKAEVEASQAKASELELEARTATERGVNLETDHRGLCARLKKSEGELEIVKSELAEARADNEVLRLDLEVKERRLAAADAHRS